MKCIHGHEDKIPGDDTTLKKNLLSTGSEMIQKFAPVNNICEHIIGLHLYNGDVTRQTIGHHYCSIINEDFRQCLIYDGDKKDSKLIGVEFIISEKLFKTLPDEEARLWHSIAYEVKSGLLVCPRLPQPAETEIMKDIVRCYGKTIQFWQFDRGDKLPFGAPQLMMTLTRDEDVQWDIVDKRDQEYGLNHKQIREARSNIEDPELDKRADYWEKTGKAFQCELKEVNVKR